MPLNLFYTHSAKKAKMTKNSNQGGGPALTALRQQQLFCKPSKSLFGAIETLNLGHITGLTIAPDPKKLEAVRDWPVPNSVSEVRSFLGFVNYFRRFIPRSAELARHLHEITGKHARFSWNESRQKSLSH